MPPRTRSSISSLPATPSARSINSTSTSPRTTPRKIPCCTKCGNPRAGHPRSGCPLDVSVSPLRGKQEPDITNALSTLNIETQASDADKKATVQSRRVKKSAAPEPGLMGGDTDEEDTESVKRWQDAIVTPMKAPGGSRAQQYMPCTLDTPNASFFSSHNGNIITQEDIKQSSQGTSASIPSNLSRTWSTEERTVFLDYLSTISTSPPSTTFHFRSSDISMVEQDAKRLGFHSHVIKHNDGVSLILGRTAEAVERPIYTVAGDVSENTDRVTPKGGQGAAFAGGAVVGAVATFTGLAFC